MMLSNVSCGRQYVPVLSSRGKEGLGEFFTDGYEGSFSLSREDELVTPFPPVY